MESMYRMDVLDSSIPRQRDTVLVRVMADGSWMFYDRVQQVVHATNAIAGFIYRQCDGQKTVREIAEVVVEHTGNGRAQALRHVKYIIREFVQAGVMELIGGKVQEDA